MSRRQAPDRQLSMELPFRSSVTCTIAYHEALKRTPATFQASTVFAFYQPGHDGELIEARNCARCASTLGRVVGNGALVLL